MKRLFILSMLIPLCFSAFSQKPTAESIRKRFSLSTTVFTDLWQGLPDVADVRLINQGVNVAALYSFPMDRKNHLSFFLGAGIDAHNLYHKSRITLDDNDVSQFEKFPSTANPTKPVGVSVKKNKLSVTYFDIPFGFQYKASNKFHGTLGFKVGWSMNNHTKYKGTDYSVTSTGRTVKLKETGIQNIQSLHYGPFATFGYKWFGVTASYQITSIFQKDLGPEVYPISVGVTFRPF